MRLFLGILLLVGLLMQALTATQAAACPTERDRFDEWLRQMRAHAVTTGISASVVNRVLSGLTVDSRIEKLDQQQPEFVRPIWDYLDSAVSDTRIRNGRDRFRRHGPILSKVEQIYGVQAEYLAAIWGIETAYGGFTGSFPVIRSLATIGFLGRRATFGCQEILAALRLIDGNEVEADQLVGSWAGATGQSQFLPSNIEKYAQDFDLDGRIDLWSDLADVFASTANYLRKKGWQPGQPWGAEVVLPSWFDYALADARNPLAVSAWAELGVQGVDGRGLPGRPDAEAAVIVPAGHRGPAFMILNNFRIIMRYNASTSYALAVALLADRIAGRPGIKASWPRNDRPLSLTEREELQTRLTAAGFPLGSVDGMIGPMTRAAIRAFQTSQNRIADGYASADLLKLLRDQ